MFYLSEISLYYPPPRGRSVGCRGDSEGGNGQRGGDAGSRSGCIRRRSRLDPQLDAEGARGKRICNRGVEGLRRYYEACLTGSGHRVKTTLEGDRRKTLESEREGFMSMYLGAAR